MGSPEWSQEPRFRNRTVMNNEYADEVDGYVEEWLLQHTKAELLELALEHRIPLAPVRGFDEVRTDPSLSTLFAEVDHPDTGPVALAGSPYSLPDAEVSTPTPAPTLGQHNSEVYCGELGFTPEEVSQLYRTGII